jgi:hypothetical protein
MTYGPQAVTGTPKSKYVKVFTISTHLLLPEKHSTAAPLHREPNTSSHSTLFNFHANQD